MDDHDDRQDAEFPGPGKHNIVKSRTHQGECLKCGLRGSWDSIKSQECRSQQPTPSPMEVIEANPDKTVVDHTKSLSAELDQALQAGKSEEAMEIMTLLEIQHEHDKIEDEELALQMMEEELKILEMTEQLHKLEMQALEEQETIQMNYAKDLSMKDVARPPARPLVSSTPVPAVCT